MTNIIWTLILCFTDYSLSWYTDIVYSLTSTYIWCTLCSLITWIKGCWYETWYLKSFHLWDVGETWTCIFKGSMPKRCSDTFIIPTFYLFWEQQIMWHCIIFKKGILWYFVVIWCWYFHWSVLSAMPWGKSFCLAIVRYKQCIV